MSNEEHLTWYTSQAVGSVSEAIPPETPTLFSDPGVPPELCAAAVRYLQDSPVLFDTPQGGNELPKQLPGKKKGGEGESLADTTLNIQLTCKAFW